MGKKLCILHGNCQGETLASLLGQSEEFSKFFQIRYIVNYTGQKIPPEDLQASSLFLYQFLGERWGANASGRLLKLLPAAAEHICFPNMFFQGYWPFWQKDDSVIEFADSFLENLLKRNLPLPLLLKLYRKCEPALVGDFNTTLAATLAHEREKEKRSPIKYVHLIEENWRERQIFLTINHPAMPLLIHVANSVLKLLGLAALPRNISDNFINPYDAFWLPIHPAVGERLSLPFAQAERKYNCYKHKLTHAEYTNIYLACRMENTRNLSAVLSQISLDKNGSGQK